MSTNFVGDPLKNTQIKDHALQLRQYFRLDERAVPDMLGLLERDAIVTRFGEKRLACQVVADDVLGGDEAITLVSNTHVRIRVSRSTYDGAEALDRRARWTIAHELGHAALHKNDALLARARSATIPRVVPAYVSVERQADVFASAFLMTDAMVSLATTPIELAEIAIVSRSAADIRWEEAQRLVIRPVIKEGLRALHAELRDRTNSAAKVTTHICPACGQQTLHAIDSKYLCVGACDRVFDGFPDGDGPT